jgi:hypothetical protein
MKISTRLLIGVTALMTTVAAHASIPMWTFTPLTATSLTVFTGTSATVQYTVTNNSKRTHTLVMLPLTGITQVTSAGNCTNPFTLSYQQSCTLTLQINGSALQGNIVAGPEVCDQNSSLQCYQPTQALSLNIIMGGVVPPPVSTTLTASVSSLGLSVNNPTLNAALTGNPRSITITNTGSIPATNVNYTVTPALPSGASITPASCGTIAPGGTCVLTITPGSSASAAASVISLQGDQTNSLTPSVDIVTYGTIYEGGYVFSVNDTTATTGSIGGTVAAQQNQSAGIIWSSNSAGVYDGGISIWGIDELSSTSTPQPNAGSPQPATLVTGQANCNGATGGSCNSNNIVVWYSTPNTSPSISFSFYAAGVCKSTINGFSDWYLPSVCELGYGSSSGCGTAGAPAIQNMASSLVDNPVSGVALAGNIYWSSTEFSSVPQTIAWAEDFSSTAGSSTQIDESKSLLLFVRCARALT